MENARILVTYVSEYSITEDGRTNEGVSVHYFFYGENGESIAPVTGDKGAIGYQRAKASLDVDKRRKIQTVPALYDAEFKMSIGSDGKPVLRLQDLQYVSAVNILPTAAKSKA